MTRLAEICTQHNVRVVGAKRAMPTFRMDAKETANALELIRLGITDDLVREILKTHPPKLSPLTGCMEVRIIVVGEDDFVGAMRAAHALGRAEEKAAKA